MALRLLVADQGRELVFDLDRDGDGAVLVGSGEDCGVRLTHPAVSRRHAQIQVLEGPDGGIEITDLGARNGTFVGGRRLDGTVRLVLAAGAEDEGIELGFGPLTARLVRVDDGDREAAIVLSPPARRSQDETSSDDTASDEPASDEPASDEPASDEPASDETASDEARALPTPRGRTETTISTASIQRLVTEMLPHWLDALEAGRGPLAMAQRVGASLFDTLPVASVTLTLGAHGLGLDEPVTPGDGPRGLAFHAARGDTRDAVRADARADASAPSVPAASADPRIVTIERPAVAARVRFAHALQARAYRAVVDSAVRFVELAAGETTPERARSESPPPLPEPASVVAEVRQIYADAAKVARGDVSVLITGESGTGKEVLAHYLHHASARRGQSFVALNCAALPRDLLESELFGIEEGVATGVRARAGCFERADGGTLFLDEIGDMAPETQARILRVLQEGTVYRLGGRKPTSAAVRVLAATNRPIDELIEAGTFRADLYHRIADWRVELPPLRRRRADIGNLAAHFLSARARERGVAPAGLSRSALERLEAYPWPGNIRQLEREIARAVLFLESGQLLESRHLQEAIRRGGEPEATTLKERLERAERSILEAAIGRHDGDVPRAAKALDIGRSTLYRRIRELGIEI